MPGATHWMIASQAVATVIALSDRRIPSVTNLKHVIAAVKIYGMLRWGTGDDKYAGRPSRGEGRGDLTPGACRWIY